MKKIYLVRHAQSNSNVNPFALQKTANPSIELTDIGIYQANQTAGFLNNLFKNNQEKLIIWNSPYKRTRQTADIIKKSFTGQFIEKESIYLSERQFGLVDDVANYRHQYLDEINHYKLHTQSKTEFFVRPPLGESPFDMCIRLDAFLRTVIETSDATNHIIVSHGAAIRGLMMMALDWKFEQYGSEPNANNASVLALSLNDNKTWGSSGYIFKPSNQTS